MCAVIYEVYQGTSKYFSSPVANVVFSTEVELPMVTICNKLKMGDLPANLTRKEITAGKFHPDNPDLPDVDIDEMIAKASREYNYFLNLTGNSLPVKSGLNHLFSSQRGLSSETGRQWKGLREDLRWV